MTDLVPNLEMFAAIAVLGLSAVLAAVSAVSYGRLRHRRALFIGLAFVLFALQGVYLVVQAWTLRGSQSWLLIVSLLDLGVLALLYLALRI